MLHDPETKSPSSLHSRAPASLFQNQEEAITAARSAQKRQSPIARAGDKVQVMSAVSAMQAARHTFVEDVVTTPLAEKALGQAAGALLGTAVDIKLAWDAATYAYGMAKCW